MFPAQNRIPSRLQVLVIGATYIDEVFFVSDRIGNDSSVTLQEKSYNLGGPGFSWSMALRRLNHRVVLATVLGTCKWSKKAIRLLKQAGITVSSQVQQGQNLDHALVVVDENNGKLVVSDRRISPLLHWTPNLASIVRGMDAVVMTSALRLEEIQAIISNLPSHVFVTLAPNKQMCRELASVQGRECLQKVQYLTLNAEEFKVLDSVENVPIVTVTQGADGGLVLINAQFQSFSPYPERIERPRNTNGAGEAFGAAFLSALLNGQDPSVATQRAAEYAYQHLKYPHNILPLMALPQKK